VIYLVDTNACISLLRKKSEKLVSRWKAVSPVDIVLCSVVVYELRYGAELSPDPFRGHAKLDEFLQPYSSLPFDDACAHTCGSLRHALEQTGASIGPHDLQIASVALQHGLKLVTHNTREFGRISGLSVIDWEL